MIAALLGALSGAWLCDAHHDRVDTKKKLVQAKAQAQYDTAIQELSNEYYKLYQDASQRKPVVVFDRVRVQAKCNDTAATSVDHGADAARVELAERTVRSVAAVAEKHATLYEQCAIRLRAAQGILTQHAR